MDALAVKKFVVEIDNRNFVYRERVLLGNYKTES